jgi:hypothetical protein
MSLETHEERRVQSTKQLEANPRLRLQTVRNQFLGAHRIRLNLMVVNHFAESRGIKLICAQRERERETQTTNR